jgi:hypothetical protein
MRDGKYVVGMVSKSVHAGTHRAALQREGFTVRDLGGERAEPTADVDIIVVRTQSCSHNASAQAYAWARKDKVNRMLIASNGLEDIVKQAKEWVAQRSQAPAPEEGEAQEELSIHEAEQKIMAAGSVIQILNRLGFFSLRMLKRQEHAIALAERHVGELSAEDKEAVTAAFDVLRTMGQRHVIRYLRGLYNAALRQSQTSVFPLSVPTTDQILISAVEHFDEYWSDPANRKELLLLTQHMRVSDPVPETDLATLEDPPMQPIEPAVLSSAAVLASVAASVPVVTIQPVASGDPLQDFKVALKLLLPYMEKAGVNKLTIDKGQVSLVRSLIVDGIVKAQE